MLMGLFETDKLNGIKLNEGELQNEAIKLLQFESEVTKVKNNI